jgi:Cu-Zn family superoxide dismutase
VSIYTRFLAHVVPVVLLAACGGAEPAPATAPGPESSPVASPSGDAKPAAAAAPSGDAKPAAASTPVEVPIAAKSGSKLSGKAMFTQVDGGVKVTIQVAGAPPGKVATHVHETGDCSAPDGKSAGGHFNPGSKPHGMPPAAERHLGDLGNIEVKPDGTGSHEIVVKGATLEAGVPTSYLGRAIIVHEKQDDGGQPTGNAGGRIGCGVIAAAK